MSKPLTHKDRLMKTKDNLNTVGINLRLAHQKIFPYLATLRANGQYTEYILIGSQVIEYMLSNLILQIQHTMNLSLLVNQLAVGSDMDLEFKFSIQKSWSLSTLIDVLIKNFFFKDENLAQAVKKLAAHRNNFAHHLIDDYGGNIQSAHNDVAEYSKLLPIESLFNEILKIQNGLVEETPKRNNIQQEK